MASPKLLRDKLTQFRRPVAFRIARLVTSEIAGWCSNEFLFFLYVKWAELIAIPAIREYWGLEVLEGDAHRVHYVRKPFQYWPRFLADQRRAAEEKTGEGAKEEVEAAIAVLSSIRLGLRIP